MKESEAKQKCSEEFFKKYDEKTSSTTGIIPNQIVGRYCPASLEACMKRRHSIMRYVPRETYMINLDTSW